MQFLFLCLTDALWGVDSILQVITIKWIFCYLGRYMYGDYPLWWTLLMMMTMMIMICTSFTVDTTPPTVTCINNIVQTVELGVSSAVVTFTEPTATDLSGQANLITRTNAPGDTFPLGTTTVTYVFADNSGNTADPCTFTITVNTGRSASLLSVYMYWKLIGNDCWVVGKSKLLCTVEPHYARGRMWT